jgi:hypothetical protein
VSALTGIAFIYLGKLRRAAKREFVVKILSELQLKMASLKASPLQPVERKKSPIFCQGKMPSCSGSVEAELG